MSSTPTATKPLLHMERIAKRFGATLALSDVTLSVRAGETLALIGENGAGKSTLMKVLSGAHSPDSGSMSLGDQRYCPNGPLDARRAGVAMIYQELNLALDLSVEDNIMLGQEHRHCAWLNRRSQKETVSRVLNQLGLASLDPRRLVGTLPIGAQQLIEIARALVSDARVMIFDEPTSSLPSNDVQRLFAIIRQLQQQGMAIIYISHFLEEIRQVANHFVVLRDGRSVAEGRIDSTSDQQIVSMMAGRSVDTLFPVVDHQPGNAMLAVDLSSHSKMLRNVKFEVRRGEIFGLFGLVGAGRTETLRSLFGLDRSYGSIRLNKREVKGGPRRRIDAGMGLVSEDRKLEGLAQSMSIADNLTLSHLTPYSKFGLLRLGARQAVVRQWMQRLSVKARGPEQAINKLSGGNQQKVALARVLHQDAELLLLDEPTRGIDVGTKAEIYRLVGELALAGKAIVLVSSYLPELLAICDTIGVMSRGKLREVRPAAAWTEHDILSAAITSDA